MLSLTRRTLLVGSAAVVIAAALLGVAGDSHDARAAAGSAVTADVASVPGSGLLLGVANQDDMAGLVSTACIVIALCCAVGLIVRIMSLGHRVPGTLRTRAFRVSAAIHMPAFVPALRSPSLHLLSISRT